MSKNKEKSLVDMTAEDYQCPLGEERLYHVKMERVRFSEVDGKRASKPYIQKFGKKEYAKLHNDFVKQGYTVEIMHDPVVWEKENAELLKQREQEAEIARIKAAEELAEKQKTEKAAEIAEAVDAAVKEAQKDMDKKIADAVAAAMKTVKESADPKK